nr:thioredoxin H2-like [Ipomoea batatas]
MGNNSSSTLPGSFVPFSKTTDGSSAPKKPLVTAFHSSSQWKLHFDNSKGTNKLMVIDFTATWCGPCKRMEPTINDFAAQYTDVEFVKIDVDELPDVAQYFEVQAMPTFVLVKNGNVIDKVVGADKDVLLQKILKHSLEGNLISNLILKFPFLPGSFDIGIPSFGITCSCPGFTTFLIGTARSLPSKVVNLIIFPVRASSKEILWWTTRSLPCLLNTGWGFSSTTKISVVKDDPRNLHLPRGAIVELLQATRQLVLHRRRLPRRSSSTTANRTAFISCIRSTKNLRKYILRITRSIVKRSSSSAAACPGRRRRMIELAGLQRLLAVQIVDPPLLRVAEHIVSLGNLLEFRLRFLHVLAVLIRMPLHR